MSIAPVHDVNIYNEMVQVDGFLTVEVYGSTLLAENNELQIWTTSNSELTSNQVSNPIIVFDTGLNKYVAAPGQTLNDDQIKLLTDMNTAYAAGSGVPGQNAFATILNDFGTQGMLNNISEVLGVTLIHLLQTCWNSADGSLSSGQMTNLSAINQSFQGLATQNESGGQGMIKTEGSQVQTTTGLPQNMTEMVNAILAILGAIAGLLQQAYS